MDIELAQALKEIAYAKELLTRFVMASVYFNGKEADLVEEAEEYIKKNNLEWELECNLRR